MEQKNGKLILDSSVDSRDKSILIAINKGMNAREQTERILPHEADFMDRVQSTVSDLAITDHISLALSSGEARIAVRAIQENTRLEQRTHDGAFVFPGSAIANASLPEISGFVLRYRERG